MQDNRIMPRRAWLLLGLVPMLSVREGFLVLTSPVMLASDSSRYLITYTVITAATPPRNIYCREPVLGVIFNYPPREDDPMIYTRGETL
ncbi:hypothetical protein J6590_041905 [Homalodisca vitripennis]|nr:hypothetical protein J6590_041905 [Homalodisca vitripennis]